MREEALMIIKNIFLFIRSKMILKILLTYTGKKMKMGLFCNTLVYKHGQDNLGNLALSISFSNYQL